MEHDARTSCDGQRGTTAWCTCRRTSDGRDLKSARGWLGEVLLGGTDIVKELVFVHGVSIASSLATGQPDGRVDEPELPCTSTSLRIAIEPCVNYIQWPFH